MATTQEYKNYLLEELNLLDNIVCKPMMGEYLLYYNGILFGGIYDDRFLIKKSPSLEYLSLSEEIPYDGAKPMYLIDSENKLEIAEIIYKLLDELK
jgi:TfoX/Sxy family transcriptional regulator of competence genes